MYKMKIKPGMHVVILMGGIGSEREISLKSGQACSNALKENGFKVTDKVNILVENNEQLKSAIQNNFTYICDETLADKLEFSKSIENESNEMDLVDGITAKVSIKKH